MTRPARPPVASMYESTAFASFTKSSCSSEDFGCTCRMECSLSRSYSIMYRSFRIAAVRGPNSPRVLMRRETAIRVTPLHIALARDRPTGHLDPCEEALVPECGGHGNESPQHINAAALNQRRACDQAIVSTLAK